MNKLAIIIALTWLFPTLAMARDDDHLLPEYSVFSDFQPAMPDQYYDDYEENVLRFFSEAFEEGIFARVVVFPSFSPEYVIAISRDNRGFKLLHLEADVMLWPFEDLEEALSKEAQAATEEDRQKAREYIQDLRSLAPENRDNVSVNRCEYALPSAIGQGLHSLWAEMLFRTRYPDRRPIATDGEPIINIQIDGTNYHFSFEYKYARLAGRARTHEEGSINGEFVAITDQLKQGCVEIEADFFVVLEHEIQTLLAELDKAVY